MGLISSHFRRLALHVVHPGRSQQPHPTLDTTTRGDALPDSPLRLLDCFGFVGRWPFADLAGFSLEGDALRLPLLVRVGWKGRPEFALVDRVDAGREEAKRLVVAVEVVGEGEGDSCTSDMGLLLRVYLL
jgi:hypothetical protein